MVSIMESFQTPQGFSALDGTITPHPFFQTLLAPSPTATILRDEYGREDLRPRIVPGSQEWEWIQYYFPELTTPEGLSDDVTLVIYDQIRNGFQIKTRSDGEYWLFINRYDRSVMPVHFPPAATSTPVP